jgi:hypothetical protein
MLFKFRNTLFSSKKTKFIKFQTTSQSSMHRNNSKRLLFYDMFMSSF